MEYLGSLKSQRREPSLTDEQCCTMRDRMAARGPDDATMMRRENVVFAHRRLAIRDPSSGRQPWVSQDGRYALIYNGEIYNDDELREKLTPRYGRFATRCDTEVLMAAWQTMGPECIEHLRGMFAFGVYDFSERKLFLVRDRLGIKPLFYARIGSQFVFASTVSAIIHHPQFSRKPNLRTVSHYLATFRTTLGEETVYEGVSSLLPAQILSLDSSHTASVSTYWMPPAVLDPDPPSFDEAVELVHQSLSDSVSVRLRSDVPVGMMLSGGVDSNTLACLLKKVSPRPRVARCGGGITDVDSPDSDFLYAKQCADLVGFDYQPVGVDAQTYRRTWMDLISVYETPLSTPTDVIIHQIALSLTPHVGVALGGEGADEVCSGYQVPHASGWDYDLAKLNHESASHSLQRCYGRDSFISYGDHYLQSNSLIPVAVQESLFQPAAWKDAFSDNAVLQSYDRIFESLAPLPSPLRTAHVLLKVNLEGLLTRLDHATMSASLESRVPYTDHRFIEKVFSLPLSYRMRITSNPETDSFEGSPLLAAAELAQQGRIHEKRVLRTVASRLMPQQLAARPKASFPTPVAQWAGDPWRNWIVGSYSRSEFAQRIFQRETLQQVSIAPPNMAMWNWPLMNVILWAQHAFE